jgi:hypothetical protein
MKRMLFIFSLLLAAWIGLHLAFGPDEVSAGSRTPGQSRTNVTIAARVEEFTEWADSSQVIFEADWSGPLNKTNQRQTASRPLVLFTNADTAITARPGLNNGILTQGSHTLNTAYRISGAVAAPDRNFKNAQEFFSPQNAYQIVHVAGTGAYTINLEVQMSSPRSAAPDEGLYTCGVTLIAGW